MPKISLLIPTFNCAQSLQETLASAQWVDDIVVVDSYSSDNTVAVAKQLGARVVQRVYDTPSAQKNWALQFCQHNWVLQLDSDEKLAADAEGKIRTALENLPPTVSLLRMPRKNHVLGQWVRYGGLYPDYQTRLFNKQQAQFNNRVVHEKVETQGQTQTIAVPIIHYGMPNLSKQLKNLDRYTRYEADQLFQKGARPSRCRQYLYPLFLFAYRFLYQQGFRDGWRGLFLAVYNAFYYFVSRTKLREMYSLSLKRSPQ